MKVFLWRIFLKKNSYYQITWRRVFPNGRTKAFSKGKDRFFWNGKEFRRNGKLSNMDDMSLFVKRIK